MKMTVKSVLIGLPIIVLFLVDIRDFVSCVLGKCRSVLFVKWLSRMLRSCGRFEALVALCLG